MNKRWICLLLSMLLLSSSFAGCSETPGSPEDAASPGEETPAQDAADGEAADPVPDEDAGTPPEIRDYEGYEFRVFNDVNLLTDNIHATFCDEITGEPVSDEIYNRDRRVEQNYNVTITGAENGAGVMKKAVAAGDDACDISMITVNEVFSSAQQNYLLDFNTVPGIDLSNPWWDQRIDDDYGVYGKVFTMVGDYTLRSPTCELVLQFNQDLITDYGLSDPYQLVWDGSWTNDAMWSMAVQVTNDVNGDGEMANEDMWGLITEISAPYYFFTGSGNRTVIPDAENGLKLNLDNEVVYDALMNSMFFALDGTNALCVDDGVFRAKKHDSVWSESTAMFTAGQCLFRSASLGSLLTYRDMEMDFGVLPIPKMSEEQDGYYCLVSCWDNPVVIPITVSDAARTGNLIEALFYESHTKLKSAFYDTLLAGKVMRDEESVQMLALVIDSKTYDLDWAVGITDIFNTLSGIARSKTDTLTSRIAKMSKSSQKKLELFLGKFQ